MGCISTKHANLPPGYEDPKLLATETSFTVSQVEAFYELFKKLSCLIIKDGLIHKEEFQLALLRDCKKRNLFTDRLFDLFDIKRNGVIEFGEFVRSLSIFHPDAPEEDKIAFAFRLYDLGKTGYIEYDELKDLVVAFLNESELYLSDEFVEQIVDKTFSQVDAKGDGRIDPDEWREFAKKNRSVLRHMTLPYLNINLLGDILVLASRIETCCHNCCLRCKRDITVEFPSFEMHSEVKDEDMTTE